MTQASERSDVLALEVAMDGFPKLWAELSPIGKRVFLREIERTLGVLDDYIDDPAVKERVLRALADPNT